MTVHLVLYKQLIQTGSLLLLLPLSAVLGFPLYEDTANRRAARHQLYSLAIEVWYAPMKTVPDIQGLAWPQVMAQEDNPWWPWPSWECGPSLHWWSANWYSPGKLSTVWPLHCTMVKTWNNLWYLPPRRIKILILKRLIWKETCKIRHKYPCTPGRSQGLLCKHRYHWLCDHYVTQLT